MGKVLLTEYNISNKKLKEKTTIASMADAHSEYEKLERIKDILKDLKITKVLIAGDMIESVAGSDYQRDKIVELLQEISKFATIVYSHGNHDTVYLEAEPEEDRERLLENNYRLWDKLKDTDNIIMPKLPDNTSNVIKTSLTSDIDVSSISIPPNYYYFRESPMEYEIYIRSLDMIRLDAEKFNILLAHSPKNAINGNAIDEYLKSIKRFNLIVTGHMHSGLIPNGLRNKSRRGLLGPGKKVFPENSYGIMQDEDTVAMINGGITKLASGSFGAPLRSVPGMNKLLDKVYPPEIDIINLFPGDNTVNKVKELKI